MSNELSPGAGFVALTSAFCEFAGLPAVDAQDTAGFEIEAGPHVARVLPDPSDDARLVVEIDVCPKDAANARALEVLHRLNYATRFTHPWTSGIDGDDTVVIYTRRTIAEMDVGALEALIADGIDRAVALRTLWDSAAAAGAISNAIPVTSGAVRA